MNVLLRSCWDEAAVHQAPVNGGAAAFWGSDAGSIHDFML
jgi:hypothetical protein